MKNSKTPPTPQGDGEPKKTRKRKKLSIETIDPTNINGPDFTCMEVALIHNLSAQTVRRIFEKVPGVVIPPVVNGTRGKRNRYVQIRIPRPVHHDVFSKYTVKAAAK